MPVTKNKMSDFGYEVLKALQGKSLTELSKELGVRPEWVSRALREPPTFEDRRKRIADHLDIKI